MKSFFKILFQKMCGMIGKEILLFVFLLGFWTGGVGVVIAGYSIGFYLAIFAFAISVLIFLRGMKKFDKTIMESYYMFKELEEDN